jgi:predicted molibdopterin-dependent oxidoreductase YjgC
MSEMTTGLDRRMFMKATAMAGAVSMLPGAAAQTQPAPNGDVKWGKAPCRFCGTGCGVLIGVKDGRVVGVQGDKNADVNKGLLCMKGYHVGLVMSGPDRITKPRLRVGPGFTPADYKDITWEEAVDVVAQRILAKPGTFGMYGSGQWTVAEGYVANKFVKGGLGQNNIDPNARLCMASAAAGYNATYGVDEPPGCYDDLDHCTVAHLLGQQPGRVPPRALLARDGPTAPRGQGPLHRHDHPPHALQRAGRPLALLQAQHRPGHRQRHRARPLLQAQETRVKDWVKNHFRFRQRTAEYVKSAAPTPATTTGGHSPEACSAGKT